MLWYGASVAFASVGAMYVYEISPPFDPYSSLLMSVWVVQAVVSAIQVRKFSRRLDRPQRKGRKLFQPPAVVIVPFKGLDIDLPEAVRSLCEQDYPDYELLLVVESEDDPAYPVLVEQVARYPDRKAKVIVAGQAAPDEGQKVHNQLFALALIEVPKGQDQAWVFADSDAVPGAYWIATMIQPLIEKKRTGVVTGYRWLIPSKQSTGIWSHLASVINSSAACMAGGREALNQVWGGSMAVLAETAIRGGLQSRLRGALTEDYQFTRMCRDLKMRVYFPNRLLIGSPIAMNRKGFFNFAYRQYVLTRVYAPKLFVAVLLLLGLYVVGTIVAWRLLIEACWNGEIIARWLPPALAIAAVFIANQMRSTWRRRVVAKALGPKALADLTPAMRLDRWATTVWMTLHWLLVLRACFGRTLKWRGITYRLNAPQSVKRLS